MHMALFISIINGVIRPIYLKIMLMLWYSNPMPDSVFALESIIYHEFGWCRKHNFGDIDSSLHFALFLLQYLSLATY